MRRHSPYNYAFNNPVYFIDPDGMRALASNSENRGSYYSDERERMGMNYIGTVNCPTCPGSGTTADPYQLDEIIIKVPKKGHYTTDGIYVYGNGGETLEKSLENDRGSGSFDGSTIFGGGVVPDLFSLGNVIGMFIDYLIGDDSLAQAPVNATTMNSATSSEDQIVEIDSKNFVATDPIRGNQSQVHAFTKKTTVNKSALDSVNASHAKDSLKAVGDSKKKNQVYNKKEDNKYMKKILSFILVFMFFACNNKNNKDIISKGQESKKYWFAFPDTLIVNKKYNGVLYYESKLDSISEKIGDIENYRYSRLLISTTDKISSNNDEIIEKIKDTFWAKNNRKIIFTNISFNKSGVFYLEGFIYNIAGVKLNRKDENGEYIYDMIEEYEPVIHKVFVIDK